MKILIIIFAFYVAGLETRNASQCALPNTYCLIEPKELVTLCVLYDGGHHIAVKNCGAYKYMKCQRKEEGLPPPVKVKWELCQDLAEHTYKLADQQLADYAEAEKKAAALEKEICVLPNVFCLLEPKLLKTVCVVYDRKYHLEVKDCGTYKYTKCKRKEKGLPKPVKVPYDKCKGLGERIMKAAEQKSEL